MTIALRSLQSLPKEQVFSNDHCVSLAKQLCTRLQKLHDAELSHQHLSSKTVLFTPCLTKVHIGHIYPAIPFKTSSELSHQGIPGAHVSGFVSPEQHLRIAKTIDFRSDIYALGIVLYLMLTGKMPLYDQSGGTLLNFHDALDISTELKSILQKMTARFPEDRYQSFTGIIHDLNTISGTSNTLFFAGQFDTPEHLFDARHLFGREEEIEALHTAVKQPYSTRLLSISGEAGVGKTTLIQTIMSQLYHLENTFIYTQAQATYNASFPTLSKILSQLLSNTINETNALKWSKKIQQRLRSHTHLIAAVFPELQPVLFYNSAPLLTPTIEPDKLFYAFATLFKLLTENSTKTLIILDDAQWLSESECDLLNTLINESVPTVLFTLSYRKSECPHYLNKVLHSASTQSLQLSNLSKGMVTEWMSCQFNPSAYDQASLSDTLFEMTKGNPQRVTAALNSLKNHNALYFQKGIRKWVFRLNRTYSTA